MKKIIASMAVATSILFYLPSCKKDHTDTPIEVKFSAEGLSYVLLPLNKYFIYKDSASGTLDSVIVTQSKVDKIFSPVAKDTISNWSAPAMNTEKITILFSKHNGSSSEDWFYGEAFAFSMGSESDAPIILFEKDRLTNTNKEVAFWYPFSNNVLPSITIEGKTYLNAVTFSFANTLITTQPTYYKSTYYWVKGTGIIKREIRTSNSIKTDLLVRNG